MHKVTKEFPQALEKLWASKPRFTKGFLKNFHRGKGWVSRTSTTCRSHANLPGIDRSSFRLLPSWLKHSQKLLQLPFNFLQPQSRDSFIQAWQGIACNERTTRTQKKGRSASLCQSSGLLLWLKAAEKARTLSRSPNETMRSRVWVDISCIQTKMGAICLHGCFQTCKFQKKNKKRQSWHLRWVVCNVMAFNKATPFRSRSSSFRSSDIAAGISALSAQTLSLKPPAQTIQ